ncbi:MAG: phosphoribosylformylglycinamidine synthase, partial [Clostridiaceae bacterium]|nr:phosphoribosylformylglycinamidine synthase [Clostridiaceae bacterium]
GNQVGLATGLVDEVYHPGYIAKRMEIGAELGAVPAHQVRRAAPKPGDRVILLGGRTGRDGCGGATGSSRAHDEQSIVRCGSEVQKGNAPTERKIQRLFRDPQVARLIKRCNDFGAGGVSVAIGELADGMAIDLDRVPRKYEGLYGTELASSESQERMAVVVGQDDAQRFIAHAEFENLEAVAVATVTQEPRMTMTWRGQTIVDLPRAFIDTNGAPQQTDAAIALPDRLDWFEQTAQAQSKHETFAANLKAGLASLAGCSRRGLAERFDSTIGAGTILMPYGGQHQLTPEIGMAALLPTEPGQETDACSLMTYGFDPELSAWSPYHGAVYAVLESLARIAALGGDAAKARLTFQEYFRRLTSEQDWGQPLSALLGAFRAQLACQVPAIGGKDSMSGSFRDLHVPPTLVSFAVQVGQAGRVVSATLDQPGRQVVLLPVPLADSKLALPDYTAFMDNLDLVNRLTTNHKIAAAATVGHNGAAVAVARMCFGNRLGFAFAKQTATHLFRPGPGSLLLALDNPDPDTLNQLETQGAIRIGETLAEPVLRQGDNALTLDDAITAWEGTLEAVFPTRTEPAATMPDIRPQAAQAPRRVAARWRTPRPRVFIPVFPGTNCEYDSTRAFLRAGAEPDSLVVRNNTPEAIQETIDEMAARIRAAQILMLPGGFSAGDEPEGSGKFIAAFLRNPQLAEAIADLLERRDGLVLGICNGFQALVKLGLLPTGRIGDLTPDSPTLTFNRIGRHVSRLVTTRVIANRSPWLMFSQPGDLHEVAISHGEGRFIAPSHVLEQLVRQGQVATQYVGPDGQPARSIEANPNGSASAIEGITSLDGRIFGKMGHAERSGHNRLRNIPGEKDQRIFEGGVAWFRD